MESISNLGDRLNSFFEQDFTAEILWTVVIVASLLLLRWITVWVVFKRTEDVRIRYRAGKIATYIAVAFGFFLIGSIWISGFSNFSTFLGLVSAGLAIALRDPVVSMAGWFYILWRKPFEVGDRISVGDHAGDVVDVRLFRFTVLEIGNWVEADQSTGRIIHVPNSHIFTHPIGNYTQEFHYIWNEIKVLITFESNWELGKQILQQIADQRCINVAEEARASIRRAARSAMILYSTLTPRVYTSVVDSGVLLTIRYLCNARQRRGTAELIWEDILGEFGQRDDIDFAYPTIRRFQNNLEGKAEAGGPPRISQMESE